MIELKCKDCEKYWKTGTEGYGVCSLPAFHFVTKAEENCQYLTPPQFTCEDCARYSEDMDCSTNEPDEKACKFFVDEREDKIYELLWSWFIGGEYSRDKILKICEEFENSDAYRFFENIIYKEGEKSGE